MYFEAKLVKAQKSKALRISYAGLIILFASIPFYAVPSLRGLTGIGFMLGLVIFILGIVLGKGDTAIYKIDGDLLKFQDAWIQIGPVIYPLPEISGLFFYYDSFNGQSENGYFTEKSRKISQWGLYNRVSFVYRGMKISATFYLTSYNHAESFFAALQEWRDIGVNYIYKSKLA